MAFDSWQVVPLRPATISIHDHCDVSRDLFRRQIRQRIFGILNRRIGHSGQVEMDKSIELTSHFEDFCLCLAINYGARQEIVDAVRSIVDDALTSSEITEETISSRLYTAGMPDPDLLIRTAGEMRISNYLLWQISYAELWVTELCWPEFRVADLHNALRDYSNRERRYGGLLK